MSGDTGITWICGGSAQLGDRRRCCLVDTMSWPETWAAPCPMGWCHLAVGAGWVRGGVQEVLGELQLPGLQAGTSGDTRIMWSLGGSAHLGDSRCYLVATMVGELGSPTSMGWCNLAVMSQGWSPGGPGFLAVPEGPLGTSHGAVVDLSSLGTGGDDPNTGVHKMAEKAPCTNASPGGGTGGARVPSAGVSSCHGCHSRWIGVTGGDTSATGDRPPQRHPRDTDSNCAQCHRPHWPHWPYWPHLAASAPRYMFIFNFIVSFGSCLCNLFVVLYS